MSVLYDIELEKVQAGMLRAVKHNKEMQMREFTLFLGAFRNKLDTLGKWQSKAIKPWLKLMNDHISRCGFPDDFRGHIFSAISRKDAYLLAWVIRQVMGVFGHILVSQYKGGKHEKAKFRGD